MEPRFRGVGEILRLRVAPRPAQSRLGGLLGGFDVLGIDDRVANQSDGAGDGFQLFAGYFEDGGGEEPCDTVITRRTSQSLGEEAVIESLLARREAVDTGCD